MTPGARVQAAIDLQDHILAEPRKPADAVVGAYFRQRRFIGGGDRRDIAERVYGVLRRRAQLEWWLARAGWTSPADGRALLIADLALHDGWSADRVAGGFDGGRFRPVPLERSERDVLKRMAGNALDHPEQPDAVRYNIPDWIEPALRHDLGESWEAEFKALNEAAPLDIRVNALKGGRDEAMQALAAENISVAPSALSPIGLRAVGRPPLVTGAAFRQGLVEIQDEGSQLVALLVDARPGMRVVDFCAGAGGKTLAVAAAMQNKGQIVACDVSAVRLERAVKRLRRAGIHNVTQRVIDPAGRKWIKRSSGTFDRVLVDAPCTGTGTWRRNPDARWTLQPKDLEELQVKQVEILASASALVRPGGHLVYATCSLLRAENEDQIERFLSGHPEFELLPAHQAWREALASEPPAEAADSACLRLTPAAHGTDGFFVAVLQRRAKPEKAAA